MSPSANRDLAGRMAELARAVAGPKSVQDVLSEVTSAAVELIPGIDTAGILLVSRGGRFESLAGTSELPHDLDELQRILDEGPCLAAATGELVVQVDDFRADTRWPAYAAGAIKIGVLSGMSYRLYTSDQTAGALNLFGFEPRAWDEESVMTGSVLAAHAAAALLASRHAEQMHSAVVSRDRIGQAKGIIMERFKVDETAAFELMRRLSQERNTKLADIADRIISTRGDG
ncbi:GAF and ANTAR domain-containing protein [Mycobacterium crocinum]|uniref:GAF and ANTAR domain-containing protein n=1 Tax=Mycolicibacterium crocinum TaxID=388459 RepID=A0ABY3TJ23_9MYCO|nr:GAF and ANTAR domain-containing protein [Mycolicibacterium crocinum]MCV7217799.1 GAF and ANTAR domain-containing protein [Mycolicibacterium crocinum]ULN41356.1 GAF and ANTAR domain-containing protein [Mycolicibacterium crocinum]